MDTYQGYSIATYLEDYEFVEAKKYIVHKGSAPLSVVHDHMYPLFKYSDKLFVSPLKKELRAGIIGCYWYQGKVTPCLIKRVFENGEFKVHFLNGESPTKIFEKKYFLGEIRNPKLSLIWRFKCWLIVFKDKMKEA